METVVSSPIHTVVVDNTSNSIIPDTTNIEYITLDSTSSILVETVSTNILVTGLIGPTGPSVLSEEDTMYSKRVDFISDDEFYRGEALVGSQENSPVWRIRRITIINNDITELWAGGTSNFDKVWANRLALNYS